ncbi:MAG: YkgJ family cysteine cluster protein [Planctomycetota bacterium]
MSETRWYEAGLPFSCTACGKCCTRHGDASYVYLRADEAAAIASHLGLGPAEFSERYLAFEDGWITLKPDLERCAFLTDAGKCSIYEVRPKQCRTWPFWESNLVSEEAWRTEVNAVCPGSRGEGPATVHPADQVERLARETEEWYEGDGDETDPGPGV